MVPFVGLCAITSSHTITTTTTSIIIIIITRTILRDRLLAPAVFAVDVYLVMRGLLKSSSTNYCSCIFRDFSVG